jgi:hypothetical protein
MLDALFQLQQVVAEEHDDQIVFAAVANTAEQQIGHKLCTIMRFDSQTMEVQRIYSSNPNSYPTGGRKRKRDTAWGRLVLEEGRPYIGRSTADIREHFDDHETILALGLQSILNVPIRLAAERLAQ